MLPSRPARQRRSLLENLYSVTGKVHPSRPIHRFQALLAYSGAGLLIRHHLKTGELAFHYCGMARDGGPTQKADVLFYLSKEAFKRHAIDELWRVKAATSAKSLGAVITSDAVLDQVRKELRRQTGHNMDPAELGDLIKSSLLRPEAL